MPRTMPDRRTLIRHAILAALVGVVLAVAVVVIPTWWFLMR